MSKFVKNVSVKTRLVDPNVPSFHSGVNRRLTYSLSPRGHTGHFGLDEGTGLITLLRPVDRETQPLFNLTVTVRGIADETFFGWGKYRTRDTASVQPDCHGKRNSG